MVRKRSRIILYRRPARDDRSDQLHPQVKYHGRHCLLVAGPRLCVFHDRQPLYARGNIYHPHVHASPRLPLLACFLRTRPSLRAPRTFFGTRAGFGLVIWSRTDCFLLLRQASMERNAHDPCRTLIGVVTDRKNVSHLTGTIVVSQVSGSSQDGCASFWAGIDGNNCEKDAVEQLGIYVCSDGSSSPWLQGYPDDNSYRREFAISTGGFIFSRVDESPTNSGTRYIDNVMSPCASPAADSWEYLQRLGARRAVPFIKRPKSDQILFMIYMMKIGSVRRFHLSCER